MRNSRLAEEKRLLQFILEDKETLIPQDSFKKSTIRNLLAYKLIKPASKGACTLTEKGRYIKRMTSNPRVELYSRGNYVLDLQLNNKEEVTEVEKPVRSRSISSFVTLVISAIMMPFHLLRTT